MNLHELLRDSITRHGWQLLLAALVPYLFVLSRAAWREARADRLISHREQIRVRWRVVQSAGYCERVVDNASKLPRSGFWCYAHHDADGVWRYVGKSTNPYQRFRAEGAESRSEPWHAGYLWECADEHDMARLEHALHARLHPDQNEKIPSARAERRRTR